MTRRRNADSPAAAASAKRERPDELDVHLRRSPRLLSRKPLDLTTTVSKLTSDCRHSRRKSQTQRTGFGGGSPVPKVCDSGSINLLVQSSGLPGELSIRRSARLSLSGSCTRLVKSGENLGKNRSCAGRGIVLALQAAREPSASEIVKESKSTGKRKKKDECPKREEPRVVRRRTGKGNRGSECTNGWTREQELALQKAYFSEKPTPHFWRKVSKQVPGKSAQDCFDKVHSDNATPPQPVRRSRANKSRSSPIGSFSLSACKVLDPSGQKLKRCSTRQKHHIAQKTVRQLLQKHTERDQAEEADLFSLLEPCALDSELKHVPSTPKNMQQKLLSLEKFSDRSSSSGQKKPLSRFSNTRQPDIVTPPVLKKVKDRFLHEKYIDQLHCRDAKRKAASSRGRKSAAGKENVVVQSINIQNVDAIKVARNSLYFDARDAIDQLCHLRSDPNSDSSDCNGDSADDEDD